MSSQFAISVRKLTVRYGAFTAIRDLDLDVGRGERVGLIGPNGAGKSSVLRVLAGQCRPSAGSVTIAEHDLLADWTAIKPVIGYAPDRDSHFDEFTGRGNLDFFAGLFGVDSARVCECLTMVELDNAADVLVRGYSLGMRRKLLLARALLHRPRVLLLDEPTAHLDAHSAELVQRLLADAAANGCAILLTGHDDRGIVGSCDRIVTLPRGVARFDAVLNYPPREVLI